MDGNPKDLRNLINHPPFSTFLLACIVYAVGFQKCFGPRESSDAMLRVFWATGMGIGAVYFICLLLSPKRTLYGTCWFGVGYAVVEIAIYVGHILWRRMLERRRAAGGRPY